MKVIHSTFTSWFRPTGIEFPIKGVWWTTKQIGAGLRLRKAERPLDNRGTVDCTVKEVRASEGVVVAKMPDGRTKWVNLGPSYTGYLKEDFRPVRIELFGPSNLAEKGAKVDWVRITCRNGTVIEDSVVR